MNVTAVPEQKPDVVITISWREAEILRTMLGRITGIGQGSDFASNLFIYLNNVGVRLDSSIIFSGEFK